RQRQEGRRGGQRGHPLAVAPVGRGDRGARRRGVLRGRAAAADRVSAGGAMLVVLEGLDGAGTTTQARRLGAALEAAGPPAGLTREPSDGPVGRLLREMLTGGHALPGGAAISQATFSLLFAADRLDHLQREVEPALARGAVVVSDRWYHSSLAYQG